MTEDEAKDWIDNNMSVGGSWNDATSLAQLVNDKLRLAAGRVHDGRGHVYTDAAHRVLSMIPVVAR